MEKIIVCPAGEDVKHFLQEKSYGIFYCGGRGTCGKCKTRIVQGNGGELTEAEKNLLTSEEIAENTRLLCQIKAVTEIMIAIELCMELEETANFKQHFYSEKIDQRKQREEREQKEQREEREQRRQGEQGKQREQKNEKADGKQFGAAFDIGTTTVTGKLFDLTQQCPIAEKTEWNPQVCFGADIMTRMQYCLENPDGIAVMQEKIAGCLDKILEYFKEKTKFKEETKAEISSIMAVGNSAMMHFLLGQSVDSLAKAPFCPCFTKGQRRRGEDCGLKTGKDIELFTLPLLRGQVGGDITAALLSIDIFSKKSNTMLIDIGTNGEMALFRNGSIFVCSTAAGPALEGAGISSGMRAQTGAIERIWLTGGKIYTKVIGNVPAQGICGSSLIDAIAVLLELGKIQSNGHLDSGRFLLADNDNMAGNKIENRGKDRQIEITQEDVRQYQMVKGAIRAGIEVLLHAANAELKDIEKIYIAGSFGSNIRKQNAVQTGLLPEIPMEKLVIVGNAALQGASMALLSEKARQYAERIRKASVLVNLAEEKEFQEIYIKYMDFC